MTLKVLAHYLPELGTDSGEDGLCPAGDPRVTSTDDEKSHRHLTLSYFIDLFLKSEGVDGSERQAEKETDAPVESLKGLTERPVDLLRSSSHRSGIRNTPVRCHRLARPEGTHFVRGVVADREYKAEVRRVRFGELVP